MLYKLFTIAFMLAITTNINYAQTDLDDQSATTLSPAASDVDGVDVDDNTNDETLDTPNESDVDTDNTDDTDDITDVDNDDEDVDGDVDDDDSFFNSTDSGELETTDDSMDNTDSMDATDSNSIDDDSDSIDVDSDEEDLCIGLTQNECGAIIRDDGDAECAFNTVTGDCYDIERREGRMGSGNFDDGYNTAREQADNEQAQLELLVTVLGVTVGLLVLIIIGGILYVWTKSNSKKVNHHQMDQSMDVDGADRLIMDTE